LQEIIKQERASIEYSVIVRLVFIKIEISPTLDNSVLQNTLSLGVKKSGFQKKLITFVART
jgi:hypothetical protein